MLHERNIRPDITLGLVALLGFKFRISSSDWMAVSTINESQLIVNCTNNHPITSLFRGQLYEINEQKRFIVQQSPDQNRVILYASE